MFCSLTKGQKSFSSESKIQFLLFSSISASTTNILKNCLNSILNKQRREQTKRHFTDKVAQLAVKNGKNNQIAQPMVSGKHRSQIKLLSSRSKMAKITKWLNPWLVESIEAFNFYCCPECNFRSNEANSFQKVV